MLHNVQTAEQSLIAVIRQATAELANVGGADLQAALDELQRAADEARARLDAGADRARGLLFTLAAGAGSIPARLTADLFARPQQQGDEKTAGLPAADPAEAAQAPAVAQEASGPQTDPTPAPDAPRPAGDAPALPEQAAEPVVTVAANGPVGAAKVPTLGAAEQVEAAAQTVEALQVQARDGAGREEVVAGLDALALDAWGKKDLLALARRLRRDVAGKPGKAGLIEAVRKSVLDAQAVCAFQN